MAYAMAGTGISVKKSMQKATSFKFTQQEAIGVFARLQQVCASSPHGTPVCCSVRF